MNKYSDILRCPKCIGELTFLEHEVCCKTCRAQYPIIDSGIIDMRLKAPKSVTLNMTIGEAKQNPATKFGILSHNPAPEVHYSPSELPVHLPPIMAGYIPKAKTAHSFCLDLGCGAGEYRGAIEKAGYQWVGFDYQNPNAPLWADAHAIPFPDNTFDFIMSLAVLEHIQYPPVMLREVRRVLKPGGIYFGSVTYLVPFHDSASYYNMTHYGVGSALEDAGLEMEFVRADPAYLGIRALAYMGLFPGLKRQLAYALVAPIVWLHRLYWAVKRRQGDPRFAPEWRLFLNTGAYIYRALKPQV